DAARAELVEARGRRVRRAEAVPLVGREPRAVLAPELADRGEDTSIRIHREAGDTAERRGRRPARERLPVERAGEGVDQAIDVRGEAVPAQRLHRLGGTPELRGQEGRVVCAAGDREQPEEGRVRAPASRGEARAEIENREALRR